MVGKTIADFLRKSKIPLKHGFLLNLIKENKISILISGNYSSLTKYLLTKLS